MPDNDQTQEQDTDTDTAAEQTAVDDTAAEQQDESLSTAAGEVFDAATDGAKDAVAAPEPEAEPEAKVADEDPLKAEREALATERQKVQEYRQEVADWARTVQAGRPQSQQDEPKPPDWMKFEAQTPNEKSLHGALVQMHEQNEQLSGSVQKLTDRLNGIDAQANAREIDTALTSLKEGFAELIDGGEKEDELCNDAAAYRSGKLQMGQDISITAALTHCARQAAYDTVADKARKSVAAEASTATRAAVASPTSTGAGKGAKTLAQAAGEMWDEKVGR